MRDRKILHIDMNNCFASIEIKLRPELRGIPLVVSAFDGEKHGIVLAKSEEAKKFGIKTAEPIWQAKQKCPDILIVPPHYDEYKKHSIQAREIYYSYTNQVEPFGLDEAWLDVTGSQKLFGNSYQIAETIRKRIKKEMGITVSIGISFNKIFAKLGSDLKKPDAITVISQENFKNIVWKLAVDKMIGIGKSTKLKLNANQIYTLGDLANSDKNFLIDLLGQHGEKIWINANGLENSPVKDFYHLDPIKSISHGQTFIENLNSYEEVKNVFQNLSIKVGNRLIKENLEAMGVQISVKDTNLKTKSFQMSLEYSTFSSIILRDAALELFKNYKIKKPIRFLELRAINLTKESSIQTKFFDDFDIVRRKSKLSKTLYNLQKNFGTNIVKLGSGENKNKSYREILEESNED